jgi:hypothetical protein
MIPIRVAGEGSDVEEVLMAPLVRAAADVQDAAAGSSSSIRLASRLSGSSAR